MSTLERDLADAAPLARKRVMAYVKRQAKLRTRAEKKSASMESTVHDMCVILTQIDAIAEDICNQDGTGVDHLAKNIRELIAQVVRRVS